MDDQAKNQAEQSSAPADGVAAESAVIDNQGGGESGAGSIVVTPPTHTTHEPQRVVAGRNGGRLTPFTKETSAIARQKRADMAENVVRRALREKAGGNSWAAGVLAIAEAQYDVATSGQRGSTPAAVFVMRAAGLMGDRRDQASAPAGGAVVVLSADAVAGLAAALAERLGK